MPSSRSSQSQSRPLHSATSARLNRPLRSSSRISSKQSSASQTENEVPRSLQTRASRQDKAISTATPSARKPLSERQNLSHIEVLIPSPTTKALGQRQKNTVAHSAASQVKTTNKEAHRSSRTSKDRSVSNSSKRTTPPQSSASAATSRPGNALEVFVEIPQTPQSERRGKSQSRSNRIASEKGTTSKAKHDERRSLALEPVAQPLGAQSGAAADPSIVPDSDDLEYVDPRSLLSGPAGHAARPYQRPEQSDRGQLSPVDSYDSSDKENRPPRRAKALTLSDLPPQHSTPLKTRAPVPTAHEGGSSTIPNVSALPQAQPLVLDDIFHMSSDDAPSTSRSAPIRRRHVGHAASESQAKMVEYQQMGVAKVEHWHQVQSRVSGGSSDAESSLGDMLQAAGFPAAADTIGRALVSQVIDDAREQTEDDPFGFFECERRIKRKRLDELASKRRQEEEQSANVLDDAELARQVFASPRTSPAPSPILQAQRSPVLRPTSPEPAESESQQEVADSLDVSILPKEEELGRRTRSQTRKTAEQQRSSSPLSSASGSPQRRSKHVRQRRSTGPSRAMVQGISMRASEVKEREMLEQMDQPSSSPDAPSSPQKQTMMVDELMSFLPMRHKAAGSSSARGRKGHAKRGKKSVTKRARAEEEAASSHERNNSQSESERVDKRTARKGSTGSRRSRPELAELPDWRDTVGSSESRSSDVSCNNSTLFRAHKTAANSTFQSERTRRVKRFRRLEKVSLESELVI